MTTRRRTVRSPGAVASRPRYTWRFFDGSISLNNALAQGINLSSVGAMASLSGLGIFGDFTIRRIRGEMAVANQAIAEGNLLMGIAWGIFVSELDAFTAGAFPEPLSDPVDWMAFGTVYTDPDSRGAVTKHPARFVDIGTKAMRKVNENHQAIVFVAQWLSPTDEDHDLAVSGRILVSHGQR